MIAPFACAAARTGAKWVHPSQHEASAAGAVVVQWGSAAVWQQGGWLRSKQRPLKAALMGSSSSYGQTTHACVNLHAQIWMHLNWYSPNNTRYNHQFMLLLCLDCFFACKASCPTCCATVGL